MPKIDKCKYVIIFFFCIFKCIYYSRREVSGKPPPTYNIFHHSEWTLFSFDSGSFDREVTSFQLHSGAHGVTSWVRMCPNQIRRRPFGVKMVVFGVEDGVQWVKKKVSVHTFCETIWRHGWIMLRRAPCVVPSLYLDNLSRILQFQNLTYPSWQILFDPVYTLPCQLVRQV